MMYDDIFKKLKGIKCNYHCYYPSSKYDSSLNEIFDRTLTVNCSDSIEEHMNTQELIDYHNNINRLISECCSDNERRVLENEREHIFNMILDRLYDKS